MSEKLGIYEVNGVVFVSWTKSPLTTEGDQAPYSIISMPNPSPKEDARTDDGGVFRMINGHLRVVVNGTARKLTLRDHEILHQSISNAPVTQEAWNFMKEAHFRRKKSK